MSVVTLGKLGQGTQHIDAEPITYAEPAELDPLEPGTTIYERVVHIEAMLAEILAILQSSPEAIQLAQKAKR